MNAIELKDVSKSYGARRAIDSVSLTVERGERVVLFGPSGCGKSTLLHLIAGFIPPESGEILIGSELVATAGKTLREPEERGIGMVFQDLALWPHMTVAENIEFGLRVQRYPDAERKRRVKSMVELVGLGDYLRAKPGQLSGGEQQRVALARTLALSPCIVLMDEPLSSLDEALSAQLRMEILRLHREIGFTLLYVTHTSTEAADLSNRTIHLQHGRIVARPQGRGDCSRKVSLAARLKGPPFGRNFSKGNTVPDALGCHLTSRTFRPSPLPAVFGLEVGSPSAMWERL